MLFFADNKSKQMTNALKSLSYSAIMVSLALLAACGSVVNTKYAGATAYTNDNVVALPSTTDVLNVSVGASAAFTVTFVTDDGAVATDLSITTGLSSLPAGWVGPTSFTCAAISIGNGCLLSLTYHPTASGSGTVTIGYTYSDNAGISKTGTTTVRYAATSNDNVIATTSPAGQIAAKTGSTNPVGITFTTDDGATATDLSITAGLTALPAGWSGPATFACGSISTGSGCRLSLTYHPTAVGKGALAVSYSYTNNAGTVKHGTVTIGYTSTSEDNIVATPSTVGQIAAMIGTTNPIGVTFTTDDGATATGFSITGGLSSLPAGWSGPTSFTCASVSTGSGCRLNLTYHPTAVGSGSVTLSYSYKDNAGTGKTGTVVLSYAATSNDNVIATPSPSGQIAVIIGGTRTVAITFTTDDGNPASSLSITAGLSSLPNGWRGPATFTCAKVSTGSGCVLDLTYAPSAIASGTLTLSYAYKSNSGAPKTGSIRIPYIATSQNHVIATVTPSGQIVAAIGGSQTVQVNFTTDDSNPATNLAVMPVNLTSLPAGWTGPATFTCASVSTGNGCELSLTYAPTQAGSGTVVLDFGYTNDSGVALTGSVNISYAAGADNTVIGTPSPNGTINAVVSQGSQMVTVTFDTNDGRPASDLEITGGLSPLPYGWIGPTTFTCASVSTGNGCQLTIWYQPPAAGAGTLQLNYSYYSNSGTAKTGSVSINYRATTNDNLVVTQSPSGSISAVVNSGSVPVTLTFTTDDGSSATAITITSGLDALPAGWSGPAAFSCATASTGNGCQLTLTYAPTVNGGGTIALGYSYVDDAGITKTGTFDIAYASIAGTLYLTDTTSKVVSCTVSGLDGSLFSCANAATGLSGPTGIAFSGNWAYVAPGAAPTDVDVCPVNADGTFGSCSNVQTFNAPNSLAVSGGYLYVADSGSNEIYSCTINPEGSLSTCVANPIGTVNTVDGIAVTATTAYIVDIKGGSLTTCAVSPVNGTLSGCAQTTLIGTNPSAGKSANASPRSVAVYGGDLYIGAIAGPMILPIAGDGTVTVTYPCSFTPATSCTIDPTGPVQSPVNGFAFDNGYAYVSGSGGGGGVGICAIEASGILGKCVTSSAPLLTGYFGGMAFH
jgi:hypothetical protein